MSGVVGDACVAEGIDVCVSGVVGGDGVCDVVGDGDDDDVGDVGVDADGCVVELATVDGASL